eukprot:scaffold94496_cov15-Prasinocladus_malaysianus.AAC.1
MDMLKNTLAWRAETRPRDAISHSSGYVRQSIYHGWVLDNLSQSFCQSVVLIITLARLNFCVHQCSDDSS